METSMWKPSWLGTRNVQPWADISHFISFSPLIFNVLVVVWHMASPLSLFPARCGCSSRLWPCSSHSSPMITSPPPSRGGHTALLWSSWHPVDPIHSDQHTRGQRKVPVKETRRWMAHKVRHVASFQFQVWRGSLVLRCIPIVCVGTLKMHLMHMMWFGSYPVPLVTP